MNGKVDVRTNPISRLVGGSRMVLAVVALLGASERAFAATDFFWVGPSGGNWSNPANWSLTAGGPGGAGVPGVGDNPRLEGSGTYSVNYDANYSPGSPLDVMIVGATAGTATLNHAANTLPLAGILYIGSWSGTPGESGIYSLSGGTLSFASTNDFNGPLRLGDNSGTGRLDVTNTATVTCPGNVEVGLGGSGTLNQTGGSITVGADAVGQGKSLFLGRLAGSSGSYNMSASTGSSVFNVYGSLVVAPAGSATFTQTGGTVNVNEAGGNGNTGGLYIADQTPGGNTGSYTISGGSLHANFANVGRGSGTGALHIQGGDVVCANSSGLGGLAIGNSGSLDVASGATLTCDFFNNAGVSSMSGGALQTNAPASPQTTFYNKGSFTQGGGDVNVQGDGGAHQSLLEITLGGTYTLNTGTVEAANFAIGGSTQIAEGPGHLVLNGGTFTVSNSGYLWPTSDIQFNGGSLNIAGRIYGGGVTNQSGGGTTFANNTNLQQGSFSISAGTAATQSTTNTLLIGGTTVAGSDTTLGNETLSQSGGSITVGTLGVGNGGTLSNGTGSGTVVVSGGTLTAKTVILGSSTGGSGDLTISAVGQVVIEGGFSANDLTMNGGSLTVQDVAPPAGEDPELDRSMVGGYLRDGAFHVHGGAATAPRLKLGLTAGKTGSMNMDGGTMTATLVCAGCDTSLTSGSGTGTVSVTGGTLHAGTVLLGSTSGGAGSMTVAATGQVVIEGGFSSNDLTMNGGSLTVQDVAPPAGEDPVLDRSMVGGYLHDGAMTVNAGTVSTVNLKLGVTAGRIGTLTINGGSVTAANLLAANAGTSVIALNGGTLTSGHSDVNTGSTLAIGDGTHAAKLILGPAGGTHGFAQGLGISANATLAGSGAITGNLTNAGTVSPGVNAGDEATLNITGSYTQSDSGKLVVDIGSTGKDAVVATGAATLNGTLTINLDRMHLPGVGGQFVVVVGHPRTGTFSTMTGAGFGVIYNDTAVVVSFTGVDVPEPPGGQPPVALELGPIGPNPAHSGGTTIVAFALPKAGAVTLAILDLSGRQVRTLAAGDFNAGRHSVSWDGRDASGGVVRPGVYLVRLSAMNRQLSSKLVVR
jgi:hypothetical protein